jgi:uncharacterized protein YbbK (DUF523 family)
MIVVSACLLGHKTKYDGGSNPNALLIKYNERGRFITVCPECLGQLPVPRLPAEIQEGTGKKVWSGKACVKNMQGDDFTNNFIRGANKALQTVQAYKIRVAILKENSPSCGVCTIYDGSFAGRKIKGSGVCAALLEANGIRLYTEKNISEALLEKLLVEDEMED